jgi:hypothetical protein
MHVRTTAFLLGEGRRPDGCTSAPQHFCLNFYWVQLEHTQPNPPHSHHMHTRVRVCTHAKNKLGGCLASGVRLPPNAHTCVYPNFSRKIQKKKKVRHQNLNLVASHWLPLYHMLFHHLALKFTPQFMCSHFMYGQTHVSYLGPWQILTTLSHKPTIFLRGR